MNARLNTIHRKWRLGLVLLWIGIGFGIAGVAIQKMIADLPFNPRIITALGFLLLGIGVANLVKYGSARRDPQAASRLVIEEQDERTRLLHARAGNRAFWVSAAMAYIVLMTQSFSAIGSLPIISSEVLWYFLAAVVVVPFGVYIASLVYDEKRE
ncbi:MAG: hypothetical protein PHQ40_12565 [Anaerolineaceae bacterium]|nr:hypothetical protein [Anaerolineaceae bacterium]